MSGYNLGEQWIESARLERKRADLADIEIKRLRQIIFASAECPTNGEKRGRCFHCAHQSEGKCMVDLEPIPRGQ